MGVLCYKSYILNLNKIELGDTNMPMKSISPYAFGLLVTGSKKKKK